MTDLASLLGRIAVPRATGTPANAAVRDILKAELAARGLVVMEHVFTVRASAALRGPRPRTGVNLVVVRPRARVRAWLVAHYDSKGQPMSMALRLAALVLALGLLAAAPLWWPLAGAAALVGALWLAANRVTDDSPGAVDNATGVLAVLAVLDALPPGAPVGAIFPDAEEWGLAGARALVRERAHLFADTVVVNFDGIDDHGSVTALVHRAGPMVDALAKAVAARRWPLLPVIVDGVALAPAARACVTLMKGGWATMRAVHTPRDVADRLDLSGVREIAAAVASALQSLETGNL